jgi:hypothetical protein
MRDDPEAQPVQILVLFAALLLAQPAAPRWPTPEANLYWPLKQARIAAYREGNRAFFEALLADDFVTVGPDGRRVGRAHYLDVEFGTATGGHGLRPETEVSDFSARRTGDTVVLSYEERIRTDVGGQAFVEHLRRLDVYVRERGRWRLLTMTAVRVPEAPPVIAMPVEQLQAYAGTYRFGPNLLSTVRVEDGRLVEQTTAQQPTSLLPVGPDLFYAPPDVEARIAFERDATGRVVAQVYRAGAQVVRAPRQD